MKRYELPAFLNGVVSQQTYERWLRRKAAAHVKRDRKRWGQDSCIGEQYRLQIHAAVLNGGDRDYYTGLPLDWTLISTYDNDKSQNGRSDYLRQFSDLPTVDHVVTTDGQRSFVICSWRVNDCKNHLSEPELWDLCEQVLAHRKRRKQ